MKGLQDFVFAKKTKNGCRLYVDEDCKQPYVNSVLQPCVEELMKNANEGQIEMIML